MFRNRVVYISDSEATHRRQLTLALRHQGMETRAFPSGADLMEALAYLPAGCVLMAMRAGAVDCLDIPCPMAQMRLSLEYAFEILPAKIAHQQFIGKAAALRAHLTPREEDVLERVVAGMTSREIAKDIHIGVRTVEMHRANIMQKLRMDSLAALIRFAILTGVVESSEDAA